MTVMLYRASDTPNPQVWDWNVEHKVFDEADVSEALAGGWARHPLDVPMADEAPNNHSTVTISLEGAGGAGQGGGSYQPTDATLAMKPGEVVTFAPKRRGRPPKEG